MITPNEAERLAAAINLIRPDWPAKSVLTLINDLKGWAYRDLVTALAYVAADRRQDGTYISRTPARIKEDGPWRTASAEAIHEQAKARADYEARLEERRLAIQEAQHCRYCNQDGYLPNGNKCHHLDPNRNQAARQQTRHALNQARKNRAPIPSQP